MSSLRAPRISATLSDAAARAWAQAPAHSVTLSAAPLAKLNSRYVRTAWATRPYGLVRALTAQAAHDGECIYLRLEWAIPSRAQGGDEDALPALEGPDAFPDAIAVMFPQDGDADLTSMGSEEEPVSIWRWAGGVPGGVPETVEDLTATGIGTLRPAAHAGGPGGLLARSSGEGERRHVVLWRALALREDAETRSFAPGTSCPIGFAVWVGANQERAGIKSSSAQWSELALED